MIREKFTIELEEVLGDTCGVCVFRGFLPNGCDSILNRLKLRDCIGKADEVGIIYKLKSITSNDKQTYKEI